MPHYALRRWRNIFLDNLQSTHSVTNDTKQMIKLVTIYCQHATTIPKPTRMIASQRSYLFLITTDAYLVSLVPQSWRRLLAYDLILKRADLGADLQGWAKLDVQGCHKVVFLEQH